VETISSGGIDCIRSWYQEEELLKYTQNPLERPLTLHAIAEAQKKRKVLLLLMRSTHSTEIMLKIRVDIENPDYFSTR
jgi:hypothetical protein